MFRLICLTVAYLLVLSGTLGAQDRPASETGQALYQLVREYADLGDHRTGTEADAKTRDWFATQLEIRGGSVERQPFTFDRYEASSRVTVNGRPIPSMPLYYEGVGDVTSGSLFVSAIAVMEGHRIAKELTTTIAQARSAGAAVAVLACKNPLGEIQTPNRFPQLSSGLPVVLVPGSAAEMLATGPVKVAVHAKIVPGESANIVATFGDVSDSPIVINTPLTGWFRCAAERGTGIAVAIGLAERLSPQHSLIVVGTSGHEILDHIGLQAFLQTNQLVPALVVHLGANVALGEKDAESGRLRLVPGVDRYDPDQPPPALRMVHVRMEPAAAQQLQQPLATIGLPAVLNPPQWFGEGALWAEAVKGPLISFVGSGPQFHTPADVPENVTSPELMEQVSEAIGTAIEQFLQTLASP